MEKRIHLYINKEEGMLNGIPFFVYLKYLYIKYFFHYEEEKSYEYIRRGFTH